MSSRPALIPVPLASTGRSPWRPRERWLTLALAVSGATAFAASWFLPYWNFLLLAPQYPKGLKLVISLTGITGDTREVNTINHYIGMGHLDEAAAFERAYGGYAVGALGLLVIALALLAGRRLPPLGLAVAAALPLGFLADTFYWLYRFGHELDPTAAIHIAPFTPTLFGGGKVGQFATWAWAAPGFWLAIVGVALTLGSTLLRRRVCAVCPGREACHAVCPHALVVRMPPSDPTRPA